MDGLFAGKSIYKWMILGYTHGLETSILRGDTKFPSVFHPPSAQRHRGNRWWRWRRTGSWELSSSRFLREKHI